MDKMQKLNLVSYELCPFGQRTIITLSEKNSDYDLKYINLDTLNNPPEWFLKLSPFAQVPVLRAGDVSLFGSTIINEYIDDTSPPTIHPKNPLIKATNRSWIEFSTALLERQYNFIIASDEDASNKHLIELHKMLDQLENIIDQKPFFNGSQFSLIDAAYAPAFIRFDVLEKISSVSIYQDRPKISRWADQLRNRTSVIQSIIPHFEDKIIEYMNNEKSFITNTNNN